MLQHFCMMCVFPCALAGRFFCVVFCGTKHSGGLRSAFLFHVTDLTFCVTTEKQDCVRMWWRISITKPRVWRDVQNKVKTVAVLEKTESVLGFAWVRCEFSELSGKEIGKGNLDYSHFGSVLLTWAATNNYFHYWLICWIFSQFID